MSSSVTPLKVFKRAIAAYESGNLVKAAELCRATLARAPDHFDALHLLAVATSRRGEPEKALEIFEKAVALRPRNADVLAHRASALTEL
ncbi:MAG TPA: tetratricopeptide repeat protein, partial [Methylocystis sp.]|nr:tetratricopeptide repeat protein [Methylocystis sp.]